MVTLKDIAKKSNVSVATVSRYLNHKLTLRPETEAQIKDAIKELGYVPNIVAQSLKNNRTQNVAVIMPTVNTLYSSDMTSGISSVLSRHDYNLFIYEIENMNKNEDDILQSLRENMVAGAIFIGLSFDQRFYETAHALKENGIPCVYMNRKVPFKKVPLVYPDFDQCSRMAAEHLISTGKRKLAMIHALSDSPLLQMHIRNFTEVTRAHDLDQPIIINTLNGIYPPQTVIDTIKENTLDGILVMNELIGTGIVRSLVLAGCRLPEEIGVISFGSSIASTITSPALSNIDLQNYKLGEKSAEVLISQIMQESFEPVTVLEPRIIKREST